MPGIRVVGQFRIEQSTTPDARAAQTVAGGSAVAAGLHSLTLPERKHDEGDENDEA
jgi:hypothetical protein